jgi:hypothetical protein
LNEKDAPNPNNNVNDANTIVAGVGDDDDFITCNSCSGLLLGAVVSPRRSAFSKGGRRRAIKNFHPLEGEVAAFFEFPCFPEEERKVEGKSPKHLTPVENYEGLRLRESLTFVTLPETTVTSNTSYSYLHWVTIAIVKINK